MSKAIYVTTIESNSGKSLVSLGLLRMMLTRSPKVGYFRPIINKSKNDAFDNHTNTAISFFNLDTTQDECFAYHQYEVVELLSEGKEDEIIHNIIKKYKELEKKFDYVLVEGTDFSGEGGCDAPAYVKKIDVDLTKERGCKKPPILRLADQCTAFRLCGGGNSGRMTFCCKHTCRCATAGSQKRSLSGLVEVQ